MTANGAAGDSRKELLSTLHLSQADMASINGISKSVNRSLETLPHGEFSSANSIWTKRELKESFQDAIKGLGDAYQLQIDPNRATEEINSWVKRKRKTASIRSLIKSRRIRLPTSSMPSILKKAGSTHLILT